MNDGVETPAIPEPLPDAPELREDASTSLDDISDPSED